LFESLDILSHSLKTQLVVTGTEGGKTANILLQANAVLDDSEIIPTDQKSRDAILAELAVASGKGNVRIIVGDSDTKNNYFRG
jgi:hypothetical protein